MIMNLLQPCIQSSSSSFILLFVIIHPFLDFYINFVFAFSHFPCLKPGQSKVANFQSQKQLYNHKCPSICLFVCLSILKTPFNLNPSSFNIHPSSFNLHLSTFILHLSTFIFHHSSFNLHPSFRDF